ncbi:hypothetical protein [Maribacter sp.]|nr:hypothetical protein [Maribacter sp.]
MVKYLVPNLRMPVMNGMAIILSMHDCEECVFKIRKYFSGEITYL